MSAFSRRTVLQGSAAVGALSLAGQATAQGAAPKTRYSAFSAEGKKALASYAKAVDIMRKRSEQDITDPLGWTYQYKMHWFPDNGAEILETGGFAALAQAQKDELDKFFGPAAPGNIKRAQAEATWGKCPHSIQFLAVDFLPWHRMYLFFFERIVRKLSGDDNFSLPYWGYMDGKTSQILPAEFTAPVPNPLLHDRAASSNGGDPMDESAFLGAFWDDQAFNSFSLSAEGTPHGDVHNIVGDGGKDMSSLFLSPRDPVFWLHHCEIDRIWEGGLKKNFPTPTGNWLAHKFNFFDEDAKMTELTNGDVLKTEQLKTWPGYLYYDVPKPPAIQSSILVAQASQQPVRRTVATASNISLGGGLRQVRLESTPALTVTMGAAPLSAEGPRRLKLEISNVSLDRRAVANVGLYLNPPPNANAEELRRYLVGTISTFALPAGKQDSHAAHGASGPPAMYSFDVTRLVSELQRQGRWAGELSIVSKETSGGLQNAELKIGKVDLVETNTGAAPQ